MAPFLIALVAVFAVSLGGRDQRLAAALAQRLGRSGGLGAVAVVASGVSAAAAAVAGGLIARLLPPAAATMLVAIALLVAAAELAWARRKDTPPAEPTRSLFAILIVLIARQVGDAARFVVFALAAGGQPVLAGAGGALGGAAALLVGIALGDDLAAWPLRAIRLGLAGVLLLAAILTALAARGLIG